MSRIVGALVLAAGLAACEPIDDGGGGGGGGGGSVLFTHGFAFVRESDRNVYVVDDTGDPNSPQRLTTIGGASEPAVTRNGRLVVFVHQIATGFELQTVPTDGSAQPSTVFASGAAGCSGCTNFRYPTFNPAGTAIVFAFNRGSGNFALGKVNTDGSGFQVLTNDPATSYGGASFFPDGQSVLVPTGSTSTQLSQLQRVSLSGTPSTIVSNNLGNEVLWVVNRAVVSPDGQQVALDGRLSSGGSRIFVGALSSVSTSLSRVTEHAGESGARDTFPSWMSSSQVGFLSDAGGASNIYRVTVPTTSPGPGTLLIPSASDPFYGGT
ncbi:MAG: TolB family protein [Hyalangium sp.]|uniref:TolB family protein n=1 Tax=Hyalangium sp. TaxID=2028555 RepID=UPI00389A5A82